MKAPALSPYQALLRLKKEGGEFSQGDFTFNFGGTMTVDKDEVVATDRSGEPWFPSGDYNTPITATTEWLNPYE